MENDIPTRLSELEKKVDAIYISVEKTRKYLYWTMIISIVLFVLPLIGLLFAVPAFITNYSDTLGGVM